MKAVIESRGSKVTASFLLTAAPSKGDAEKENSAAFQGSPLLQIGHHAFFRKQRFPLAVKRGTALFLFYSMIGYLKR